MRGLVIVILLILINIINLMVSDRCQYSFKNSSCIKECFDNSEHPLNDIFEISSSSNSCDFFELVSMK